MIRVQWALVALVTVVALGLAPPVSAQNCFKIKDGVITDSANEVVTTGYDQFGYNYQARLFNGTYDSVDRNLDGKFFGATVDYSDDSLIMKWSDEWLSNLDCNGDQKLDRGLNARTGVSTGSSRGWITNQVEGDYIGADGDSHHYTYFAKIVWVGPAPASGDQWAGVRLWGEYAIIEEVYNDPYGGSHGVDRSKLAHPAGFGAYK